MNEPYQLVADDWAGNTAIDPVVLKANGVAAMIARLNDMEGGHHMDARFGPNWTMAQEFPVNAIYFVYNPWVDGMANLNWLISHLPAGYNRRVFLDVEVKYPGYSPAAYAKELATFVSLCKLPLTIYTGAWFLEYVASWPDVSDWWAAYPAWSETVQSWDALRSNLAALNYQAWVGKAPGTLAGRGQGVPLWQCVGDNQLLPGFGGQKGDVSVFPGTVEQLTDWIMGAQATSQPDVYTPTGSGQAIAQMTGLIATVTSPTLNVRNGPGLAYGIVGSVPAGAQFEVGDVAGSDAWLEIGPGKWICKELGVKTYVETKEE